jgi:hypothetical protein
LSSWRGPLALLCRNLGLRYLKAYVVAAWLLIRNGCRLRVDCLAPKFAPEKTEQPRHHGWPPRHHLPMLIPT